MNTNLEIKAALSLNLKQLRENKRKPNGDKITQTDVALAIEVTQKSYSEIESGKRWPQHETLVRLAAYFEVEETDLVSDRNLLALRDVLKKNS